MDNAENCDSYINIPKSQTYTDLTEKEEDDDGGRILF
jgi:hypothetical protein